jgi:hypothetical protein
VVGALYYSMGAKERDWGCGFAMFLGECSQGVVFAQSRGSPDSEWPDIAICWAWGWLGQLYSLLLG